MDKYFDNDNFEVYAPKDLVFVTFELEEILDDALKTYENLFDIDSFRKIRINYFGDIEKFREYVSSKNPNFSLSKHITKYVDEDSMNFYIKPRKDDDTIGHICDRYLAPSELFHLMYKELVWSKEYIKRIPWFDDGMEEVFSGEYKHENKNLFIKYVMENTFTIPNLNELKPSNFITPKYDASDLSRLAVLYLLDTLGLDEFKKLIHDEDRILSYGDHIVKDAFDYYKNKLSKD